MRPVIHPTDATVRLMALFPRTSFDTSLSSHLAGWVVSALLYVGAVVEEEQQTTEQVWARPSMVVWQQEDVLTTRTSDQDRQAWLKASARGKAAVAQLVSSWGLTPQPKFADNTRESVRDETFRGWHLRGAVRQRAGIATSSSLPRWALEPHFADLFDPALTFEDQVDRIEQWIDTHMDAGARVKAQQARRREEARHAVEVTLPDGSSRALEPGLSSALLKGVIEQWAPRRLAEPMVLTISEPGAKLLVTDQLLLTELGMTLDIATILPDALLVDLGSHPVEFWVVEAVASDGPITDERKARLLTWAAQQHIEPGSCRFLSAFESRGSAAAKRRLKDLAVGTYAWFADEPDRELAWDAIGS